ncbi:peptidyl-prolyl cis-trans isomerase [Cyclospora cayetanensis]|uniref:Peptidyl-prolyl cis-trans isomerase n=1 Tax=Cyclospora cayetanensis TaxID=88456 RepID=A0A1D3D4L3_9EIME|nr:peptidyl-prolyl cis-trans isomerase [Cyclospora cayetanensis]
MPVDDEQDDLAALEASPPVSPQNQEGEPEGPGRAQSSAGGGAEGPAAVAAAQGRARMQQQRGDWYAAQQRARAVPAVAVTPLFVSGGALHSTSTKNKEVLLPPTLTGASPGNKTGLWNEAVSSAQTKGKGASGSPAIPPTAAGALSTPGASQDTAGQGAPSSSESADDAAFFPPTARICSRPVTEFSHLAVQKDGVTLSVLCLPWLYQKLHKEVLLLGRGDSADIHTDHPSCSRAHCELRRVRLPDGQCLYTLEDLNSAHGTLVNGGKVAPRKPTVLDDDDEIQVGFSQRLYTFKKGDDRLGLQRDEERGASLAAARPIGGGAGTPHQPPSPSLDEDNGEAPKSSFLQKHLERRAKMGNAFRGRGGGPYGGDRHRWHRETPEAGEDGSSPECLYYGNADRDGGGGPWRERGGSQRYHHHASGDDGYSRGPSCGAPTGGNTTPLGGPWGRSPQGRYGGEAPRDSSLSVYSPESASSGGAPYSPQAPPSVSPYLVNPEFGGGGGGSPHNAGRTAYGETPFYGGPSPMASGAASRDMSHAAAPAVPAEETAAGAACNFAKADRVYVHHILLKFAGALGFAGAAEVATLRDGKTPMQRTREQAREYLTHTRQLLVEAPQQFGDFAAELSDCPSFARKGEVGWLRCNGLLETGELLFPPLMAAGALALEVGQLSPVLESHMGFHLFFRTA